MSVRGCACVQLCVCGGGGGGGGGCVFVLCNSIAPSLPTFMYKITLRYEMPLT